MGNFSRDTFDRLKHYVGVRLQQGVPIVDADWNELEDIRRYELQAFLKWFVGNGVPSGNNGFQIQAVAEPNDLSIRGGDGTAEGTGRVLVEGMDVLNESNIRYTAQPLFNNAALAAKWGVDPIPPLTTPAGNRTDTVYLDVWEREVDSTEDADLVNPAIGVETCVRTKREWAVRVVEGSSTIPASPAGHTFYGLARLSRVGGAAVIPGDGITDLRQTILSLRSTSDHLFRTDNPHNVTAEQIGAFPAANYEFNNRAVIEVSFTQADAHNAVRTTQLGFAPKFIWAVASLKGRLGNLDYGAQSSGFADQRGPTLQRCNSLFVYRIGVAPFYRQDTGVTMDFLSYAYFSDATVTPRREISIGASVIATPGNNLAVRFFRAGPTGTGTGGALSLQTFSIFMSLYCLG
ncbi:MAG TPA: DUF6519 domain-containing protein [Nitrospira sp.]|nr:DUF6519 domain-containing protein [Nitrospira sp.]